MTLRHIVLFRFRSDTDPSAVRALEEALAALPARIPEIVAYRHGPDLGLAEGTWHYALVADFGSIDDYRTYATHPEHQAVIAAHVTPIADEIVRVQHDLD